MKLKLTIALALACVTTAYAQSELYPKHFDLEQVTLLDSPMKTAMDKNIQLLMQYDVDRLLTPYVRQAGLAKTTDKNNKYYQWLTKHPNFSNWGSSDFDLSGHVGWVHCCWYRARSRKSDSIISWHWYLSSLSLVSSSISIIYRLCV